jgi:hypothetical protein
MSAEKRSVSTDALEVLGTVINGKNVGRDAIHLAVEPVVAGQLIYPGNHVGKLPDGSFGVTGNSKKLGIVDPFLTAPLKKGDQFLLVLYPRQITSLRHVWASPDFPEDTPKVQEEKDNSEIERAKKGISEFAESIKSDESSDGYGNYPHLSYQQLMDYADEFVKTGEYGCLGSSEIYEVTGWDTFWKNYEIVTGKQPPKDHDRGFGFFRCAC